MPRIFITGLGLISAIGNNVAEAYASLRQMKSGISSIKYLNTVHKGTIPVAEVDLSDEELMENCGVLQKKGINRTTLLGITAAAEAYRQANIAQVSSLRTGIISSTSVGGMGKTEKYYRDFLNVDLQGEFIDHIDSHDCGDSTERIADHLGIKDYVSTISTACSSSANAIMYGARLIKNNLLDRAIVGGTDSLTKFTLNGFNTLMILDRQHCRPFDENRNGLTLGEGAGYLVIESEEAVKKSGNEILAELKGFANTNDAYHQTASSPEGEGAFMAMENALKLSGMDIGDIDYVNVHGTGTSNNDLSEGRAMERLFEGRVPLFSSTKSYTGHTLAACGGIEAIFSILSIRNRMVFPNLNFSVPMKELKSIPVTHMLEGISIKNVLSNSFGFGGNNSSLIFSAY